MRAHVLVRRSSIALASVVFAGIVGGTALADDAACGFQARQEWSVKSSGGANLVIGRVENWHDEKVVHVSITDIQIPAGLPGAGTTTEISHVPFSCRSLQASIGALISTHSLPSQGCEDGYKQWRDANGGIFTVSVNEVIALMLKARQLSGR
jgi:hypothetical protein